LLARNPSNVAEAEQCFPHSYRFPSAKCEITGVACHDEPRTVAGEIGRRDEALAMLAEIYGSFTEGFDAGDLNDAIEFRSD
jgi:hypothetical protein